VKDSGMGWLAEWVRDYYVDRGYAGEALEKAVQEALDSARDLTVKPTIFKVKVTLDTFRISPYNMRYVAKTDLAFIAGRLDEKTKKSMREALINPILVRPAEEYGKWYIIAGVRRAAALLGEYAHIRIYVPSDWREEAVLSLYENIVRKELGDFGLRLVAVKAERLGIGDVLDQILDEKTVAWLKSSKKPLELVHIKPPYEPEKPEARTREMEVHKPTLDTREAGQAPDAMDDVPERQRMRFEADEHMTLCPHCGRPLKCAECGNLVR
jgi:hypothetical protein